MNFIPRPQSDAKIAAEETTANVGITAEERARRKAAIDYARGSVRLEGFVVSPFAEDLNRRYIDGEITRKDMLAALLAHHAL